MSDHALEMHIPHKGSAHVIEPRERRLAPPSPGQVRVAIEAAGVAYADIMLRRGLYPGQALPITPGYDFVGRIEALGKDVAHFSLGQRVAGITVTGSYANRRLVDVDRLVPAPENVAAPTLVAAILNGLTAWQMFHRIANPAAGEWVLVHGAAGGVGSLLLDLAKLAGVRAIGTSAAGKHAVITERGAEPIDYHRENVVERVRAIHLGGVTAAFDHIGGGHFKKVSLRALSDSGIGIVYGAYDTTRNGKVNVRALADMLVSSTFSGLGLFRKSQGIVSYNVDSWCQARHTAYREDLHRILTLVASGRLTPLVGAIHPLQEAATAHQLLESRAIAGKIVLVPD